LTGLQGQLLQKLDQPAALAFAGLARPGHAEDAPMNAAVARAELSAVSCPCIG